MKREGMKPLNILSLIALNFTVLLIQMREIKSNFQSTEPEGIRLALIYK